MNFPSKPRKLPKTPESQTEAVWQEGRRLAEWVVPPVDVDSEFYLFTPDTNPLASSDDLRLNMPDEVWAGIVAPEQSAPEIWPIGGFSSSREADSGESLTVIMFEYRNGKEALSALSLSKEAVSSALAPTLDSEGVPGAVGWQELYDDDGRHYSYFVLPHDALVVHLLVQTDSTGKGREVIDGYISAQLNRLSTFESRTEVQVQSAPVDPLGLLSRTLPHDEDSVWSVPGSFSPVAYGHYLSAPLSVLDWYDPTKIEAVAWGRATVVRFKNHMAAYNAAISWQSWNLQGRTKYSPPHINEKAVCARKVDTGVITCFLNVGFHLIMSWSTDEADLVRTMQAQVMLLETP